MPGDPVPGKEVDALEARLVGRIRVDPAEHGLLGGLAIALSMIQPGMARVMAFFRVLDRP